jgi:phosphate transport system substrate-binding protein
MVDGTQSEPRGDTHVSIIHQSLGHRHGLAHRACRRNGEGHPHQGLGYPVRRHLDIEIVEHVVGYDALAVYLHKDNPIESLSLAQLGEIFGRGAKLKRWSDLGVEVPKCKDQTIVRTGRQNNSGSYVYFRNAIMKRGRGFDPGILDMLSSKDVVHLVEKTPCAIGYSGLAYATPKVKLACIAKKEGGACVNPSIHSASDGSYPIARPLYMYSEASDSGPVKDYLNWILSDEGQCIIKNKGYAPVRPVDCP